MTLDIPIAHLRAVGLLRFSADPNQNQTMKDRSILQLSVHGMRTIVTMHSANAIHAMPR